MSPKVSVVMAAHNEAEYVEEAIESILEQTYSDFEFIIIDDGSTDSTPKIIESFDFERLRFLQNDTNQGLSASLNRGIRAAQGVYIARMDADDRSLPKRFEKQVSVLDGDSTIKVVGCWKALIDADGNRLGTKRISKDFKWTPENLKLNGPKIAHPSVMIRKDAIESVGGYRDQFVYAQDLDLWIRMAEEYNENFIKVIQESLFELRLTPDRYEKLPLQERFSSYAGTDDPAKIDSEAILDNVSTLSERSKHWLYNYTAGRNLIDQQCRTKATYHLLRSLRRKPYSIRSWYGVLLVLKSYLK